MSRDNFTPPTRTPWGGRVILDVLKADLELRRDRANYSVVGESWEISVEPNFPSHVINLPERPLLVEVVELDPVRSLGAGVAERIGGCPLLVKLLDSAQPLSVQVHPANDYEALLAHESGKPESWYVVAAQPNACLYLGLREDVDLARVQEILANKGDLSALLNIVYVQPGDCFEIGAGTIHAIGEGVTLIEPQIVAPGKVGVTYRVWDWNRRYDEWGRLDPVGAPRTLNVEHSLAVIGFDGPRGGELVESLKRYPRPLQQSGDANLSCLIDNHSMGVQRLSGTGALTLDSESMIGAVVAAGSLRCSGSDALVFQRGESFVLPRDVFPMTVELEDCLAILSHP